MYDAEFRCACYTEEVRVAYDRDDDEVEFAIWSYGRWPTAWRQRLRHIWRLLRKGDPYHDQVVLSPEDAERLGRWLLSRKPGNHNLTSVTSVSTDGSGWGSVKGLAG